jgi:hypothetical protein
MYKKIKDIDTGLDANYIKRLADETYIPFNPSNRDYQEYLKWVAEGNTPEPADSE